MAEPAGPETSEDAQRASWATAFIGIVIGLLIAALAYLGYEKLTVITASTNASTSEDIARILAELSNVDRQREDVSAQLLGLDTGELDKDLGSMKAAVGEIAVRLKGYCESRAAALTEPRTAQPGAQLRPVSGFDELQRTVRTVSRLFDSMEQRYGNAGVPGRKDGIPTSADPAFTLARGQLEDLDSSVRGLDLGRFGVISPANACEQAASHPLLVDGNDRSPILTPFERVKQRLDATKALLTQTKRETLDKKKEQLLGELDKSRKALEESPKLIVVKYLPIAMTIILAFGGLLFIAVKVIPEPVLLQLVQTGQLIQFPTVVILFAVILVLALAQGLDKEHTSTLLAAVAGYILGTGTKAVQRSRERGVRTAPSAQVEAAMPAGASGASGTASTS